MKKFIFAAIAAALLISGTVAVSHYMADRSVVAAEPSGDDT